MIPAGEVIRVLDLIKDITKNTQNISSGKFIILIDNETILK